jgi:hopanoid biosynthesis associated protein HpnK
MRANAVDMSNEKLASSAPISVDLASIETARLLCNLRVKMRARRLIVNADDFGRSSAVNQAVIRAHVEGILTSASLMVNGAAFAEAVELARQHPSLGVGLHLTLVCGYSSLTDQEIPDLVNGQQIFSAQPVRAGFGYFFRADLRSQLAKEMQAQFEKFRRTGLPLDHVNGHLHLHLHPVIFGLLIDHAQAWGIRCLRLTRDPLWLNLRLAGGRWLYRLSHAVIFKLLARRARPMLERAGIHHTQAVFGLLQNGRITESYVAALLPRLPAGDSELYSHPTLEHTGTELAALVSPRIKALLRKLDIQLVRYQDL